MNARCPDHGDLVLDSTHISLVWFRDEPRRSYYQFPCPKCPGPVRRPALRGHLEVLGELGGGPVLIIETGTGPTLTLDDIADFNRSIQHIDHLVPFCARDLSEH